MVSRKILYILIVFLSMLFMIFYSKYFPVILFIELLVLPIILAVIMLCISKKLSIKIQSQNEFSSKNKETNIKLYINNLSRFPLSKADINVVGLLAAQVMEKAIIKAVKEADSSYGFLSHKDLKFNV